MFRLLSDLHALWRKGSLFVAMYVLYLEPVLGKERTLKVFIGALTSCPTRLRWALVLEGLGYVDAAYRLRDQVREANIRHNARLNAQRRAS